MANFKLSNGNQINLASLINRRSRPVLVALIRLNNKPYHDISNQDIQLSGDQDALILAIQNKLNIGDNKIGKLKLLKLET